MLAFPGVLPSSSPRQDIHAIRVSLDLLLSSVDPAEVPERLRAIADDIQNVDGIDGHTLAKRLRAATTETFDSDLVTTVDVAPNPEQRAGFGAAPEKPGRTALSAGITIGGIFLVVALAVVAVAFFGGDRRDSPVTTDSIRGGGTPRRRRRRATRPRRRSTRCGPRNGPRRTPAPARWTIRMMPR